MLIIKTDPSTQTSQLKSYGATALLKRYKHGYSAVYILYYFSHHKDAILLRMTMLESIGEFVAKIVNFNYTERAIIN